MGNASVRGEGQAPRPTDPRFERLQHDENILPEPGHSGFGALLYDARGRLVLHDRNKTWLYTSALIEAPGGNQRDWYGKWVSYVREFNVETLKSGNRLLALGLSQNDNWSIIHDVIKISDDHYVAFYSANGSVRAATSRSPNAQFQVVPGFDLDVTDEWERSGGDAQSLESNGAHVLVAETATSLTLWIGYDSYHVDKTTGQLGWAEVRIDKANGNVVLLGKHPGNPLPLLPAGYSAARCGGNLASNVRIDGKYAYFYYSRPNRDALFLTVALSPDPLFQRNIEIRTLDTPLGDEKVIEKFESYMANGKLHVIYENELMSGHWGTGMRIYAIR